MAVAFKFAVTRPDETRARGSVASSYTPTLGHPAAAYDLYRTAAVSCEDPRIVNLCFTDIDTLAGFSRTVFGPVHSYADIDAAELALQALLFHEDVQILIPTIKLEHQGGFIGYLRPDEGLRAAGCFEIFQGAETVDWLCATDYGFVQHGRITQTASGEASLIGQTIAPPGALLAPLAARSKDVGSALAVDLKVSGYFAGRPPGAAKSPANVVTNFYDRVAVPWRSHVSSVPAVDINLTLPPLLSIALDRASSRESLPKTIAILREELAEVRAELCEFDELVRAPKSQAELENTSRRILQAFAAVVPTSRLERGSRNLAKIWSVIKPIRRAYNIAINPIALDADQIEKLIKESNAAVMEKVSLVDRTISAATFAKLLRTQTMRRLVLKHFSGEEILRLESTAV